MIEIYLDLLELGYFETKIAFEGLADEHVWKRPAEGLLSVGELAGHIAYWEAVRLAGDGGTLEDSPVKCHVISPLIDPRFRYYPTTIATPPSEQHLAMTAEQVCSELVRVHEETIAYFKAQNPDMAGSGPERPPDNTYGELLKYLVFHISYHAGQIYTARHLLGETPPDN